MRLPVLRSMRRPSLSKDQFEGVVVDYLQVRPRAHCPTRAPTRARRYRARDTSVATELGRCFVGTFQLTDRRLGAHSSCSSKTVLNFQPIMRAARISTHSFSWCLASDSRENCLGLND